MSDSNRNVWSWAKKRQRSYQSAIIYEFFLIYEQNLIENHVENLQSNRIVLVCTHHHPTVVLLFPEWGSLNHWKRFTDHWWKVYKMTINKDRNFQLWPVKKRGKIASFSNTKSNSPTNGAEVIRISHNGTFKT